MRRELTGLVLTALLTGCSGNIVNNNKPTESPNVVYYSGGFGDSSTELKGIAVPIDTELTVEEIEWNAGRPEIEYRENQTFQFPIIAKPDTFLVLTNGFENPTGIEWVEGYDHPIHAGFDLNLDTQPHSTDYSLSSNPEVSRGAKIVSPVDGFAQVRETAYGKNILVITPDGDQFYLGHLEDFAIESGQVKKGQVVGSLGSSGAEGLHLHFGIIQDGEWQNYEPQIRESMFSSRQLEVFQSK